MQWVVLAMLAPIVLSKAKQSNAMASDASSGLGRKKRMTLPLQNQGEATKLTVKSDIKAPYAEHLVSDWSLRNVCVTFHNWRGTLHRAHFVSLENVTAVIHSFSEYTFGFGRLAFVRPAEPSDAVVLASCTRRALGLAFTVTSNNLYHQFFHAVPAYHTLMQHLRAEAEFIPLVSYLSSHWLNPSTNHSHAWEFSLRAFSAAPARQLMADTLQLLTRGCTCFERVEGATGAVSLFYHKARARILAFCRQALRMARKVPPLSPLLMPYVRPSLVFTVPTRFT